MCPGFDYDFYYCYCYYYHYSYIKYGTGGITSLFRLNAVKDCTPVSLNRALFRLSITPVRVHMNVVPRSTGNTNSGTEN